MDTPISDPVSRPVHFPASCREAERIAREELGIPEDELVERASRGAWAVFRGLFPDARELVVLAGPGANGADGLALARHALRDGFRPTVLMVGREPSPGGACARQTALLAAAGRLPARWSPDGLPQGTPVVDAMYGTGLGRALDGDAAEAARAASTRAVLALDLPSGLDGATGRPLGAAVRAVATATFGRSKPGLHLHPGRELAGAVHVCGLGLPDAVWERVGGSMRLLDDAWARRRLPPRSRGAHKGDAGRVLLLCGSESYPGAAILCASAALRSGAGLIQVAASESVATRIPFAIPEAVPLDAASKRFAEAIPRADALLAGPGTGTGEEAAARLEILLGLADAPLVLDADALNLCAARDALREALRRAARARGAVVTPHPAEAARLLGRPIGDLLADPIGAARGLSLELGCVAVFKTATPVVASPEGGLAAGTAGHPGMATGGCGDALAGAVAARLAEGASPWEAACQAVRAHGRAGDIAGTGGRRGMSVTDLVSALPRAWEEMEDDFAP